MNIVNFFWYLMGTLTTILILLNNPKSNNLGFSNSQIGSSSFKKNINKFISISGLIFIVLTVALSLA
jgi:protein translocase SecG subunit